MTFGSIWVVADLIKAALDVLASELLVLLFGTQTNACDRSDFDMGGSGILRHHILPSPPYD